MALAVTDVTGTAVTGTDFEPQVSFDYIWGLRNLKGLVGGVDLTNVNSTVFLDQAKDPYFGGGIFRGTLQNHLNAGDILNIADADGLVLGAWFKTTTTGTRVICGRIAQPVAAGTITGYMLRISASKVQFIVGSGVATVTGISSDDNWNDDKWHFALASWAGFTAGGAVTLWVDGVKKSGTANRSVLTSEAQFNIGASPDRVGGQQHFLGNIGMVYARVNSGIISDAEAQSIWEQTHFADGNQLIYPTVDSATGVTLGSNPTSPRFYAFDKDAYVRYAKSTRNFLI